MINITDTKETLDNLQIPTFKTTQETCEVKEFAEPENIHQNLELPKFMGTKWNDIGRACKTKSE